MKEASILSRFRSALRERLDAVAQEPLPKQWVDLINELNERERRSTRSRRRLKRRKSSCH